MTAAAARAATPPPPARKGKANRVRLGGGGPWIDQATDKQLTKWQRHASQGVLIDRLVAHALRSNFNAGVDCL